ncbi:MULTISPECIES: 50S ribosomal protein L4 [Sorangium]|uniref:Large ribosomal subunit protein uL4 n=1 Tax=Sorangium cellulosum TaxID=56 RepID=A0A150SAB4_SORCE|nr:MULTISPECIES: 50S ribosomal protein L4 [Sorangium]AUX29190.1 50S ribosomal protein L4 [Sorangium cellulosum]KYF89352.1 50S ribosomal protein L4 [Sorangium cellulosum]KYG01180.1 50S ribosomal protein L4 [Sorangium cellulosum]WCQ88582.1 50S ribosomal protein L4 [Sorangium sp. Soce836]
MKVTVYNLKREQVGELDLSDEVFGTEVKEHLFYEVVKAQLASRRSGTKATKERSAVAGSTKKLYRQKGTGRARQGSIRAPHHAGGGMAHALEPKDWSYRPPRKVRIGALKSALSLFAKEGRLIVLDSLEVPEVKTKAIAATLTTLQADKKSLVVDTAGNEKLVKSLRNLENHQYLPPEGVNVYDLLRHDHLIVSRDAAKALEARCLR